MVDRFAWQHEGGEDPREGHGRPSRSQWTRTKAKDGRSRYSTVERRFGKLIPERVE
jgi:hypothetical protein